MVLPPNPTLSLYSRVGWWYWVPFFIFWFWTPNHEPPCPIFKSRHSTISPRLALPWRCRLCCRMQSRCQFLRYNWNVNTGRRLSPHEHQQVINITHHFLLLICFTFSTDRYFCCFDKKKHVERRCLQLKASCRSDQRQFLWTHWRVGSFL